MATYTTDRVASTIPARTGLGVIVQSAELLVADLASALATSDVVQLFTVPEGAVIIDLVVSSNGTQSTNNDAVFTVGITGGDTDQFITTSAGTVLRTGGGVARMNNAEGHGYVMTAEDTIDLLVTTGGTGQKNTGTGRIRASVTYQMQA